MNSTLIRRITMTAAASAVAIFTLGALPACTAESPDALDSQELVGADENADIRADGVTGSLKVGSTLVSTTDVNLRSGAGTNFGVLHVIPTGSKVTVVEAAAKDGFYKVKHNGTTGWTSGKYYKAEAAGGGGGLSAARQGALNKGKSVVGFSYWWGHGRWKAEGATASTKGSCKGSCPSCTHGGSYGADCSGFVAKAWSVPGSNDEISTDSHPYGTIHFVKDTANWKTVSRGSVSPADALVYNEGSAGHIVLYSSGDGWGSMYAYECKGCSAGCVYGLRTASSSYHAIRRAGW